MPMSRRRWQAPVPLHSINMPGQRSLSRRTVLEATLAAGGLALIDWAPVTARSAALTPACHDEHGAVTLPETEGPYYRPHSPLRGNFIDASSEGQRITLAGLVLSPVCRPVANALLDLWHADQNGEYDNSGFRYRGHLFSDADGHFEFHTIVPAVYPGRTRHFHLKIQPPGRPVLTTQLFFPGEPRNQVDALFRPELLMSIRDTPERMNAVFDFVVDA
jgi:protocatechuate 3,4-dioxygenase beta subunit